MNKDFENHLVFVQRVAPIHTAPISSTVGLTQTSMGFLFLTNECCMLSRSSGCTNPWMKTDKDKSQAL